MELVDLVYFTYFTKHFPEYSLDTPCWNNMQTINRTYWCRIEVPHDFGALRNYIYRSRVMDSGIGPEDL